jgi:Flp pilus assembly protein TadG
MDFVSRLRFLKRRSSPVQAGQALVELALVLPMVLLLLLGVIEIGRYAYISILVGNAAHAGAVYGAQGFSKAKINNPDITTAARNDFASNGLDPTALTVDSFPTCGCDIGGTISVDNAANCDPTGTAPPPCAGNWAVTIHVTAHNAYTGLFNYPGIPASLQLSSTASMRVSKKP